MKKERTCKPSLLYSLSLRSQDLPGQPLPAVLIPSLKLEHVNLSKWYSDFNQRRRMRVSHLGAADQVPTAS